SIGVETFIGAVFALVTGLQDEITKTANTASTMPAIFIDFLLQRTAQRKRKPPAVFAIRDN
ncbi:MAG: hypothetical protein D6732_10395, partial [Methanobacteriota archaeon]